MGPRELEVGLGIWEWGVLSEELSGDWSSEWGVGSGELGVGSGKWGVGSGEWGVGWGVGIGDRGQGTWD